jgi:hypothetical protein
MTTHAGTGLFCFVRFCSLILREVFFRAAIYERRIDFLRFLSVGVPRNQKYCPLAAGQSLPLKALRRSGPFLSR